MALHGSWSTLYISSPVFTEKRYDDTRTVQCKSFGKFIYPGDGASRSSQTSKETPPSILTEIVRRMCVVQHAWFVTESQTALLKTVLGL
jgi:hypothetical protein